MECLYERFMRGVVKVLNGATRDMEKDFILAFENIDSEIAEEIKNRMFIFDDMALLDDRSVQRFLREVEMEDLAKGLKGTESETQEKILRNMSKDAAAKLKEEMEYMGPVRMKDVNETQMKFVAIIRSLDNRGEITVPRSGEDELVT